SDPKANLLITQSPLSLVLQKGKTAELKCNQTYGHDVMFWYRQDRGQELQLLFHFYYESMQDTGKKPDRFTPEKTQKEICNLKINPEGARGFGYNCLRKFIIVTLFGTVSNTQQYFGRGSRLTVLEEGQITSPPKVTIFAPSEEEVKEKQKATIVCLATNFFPDHVSLTWYLNDEVRTDGVKTETPQYDKTKKEYSLISRIRITIKEWQNSNNKFRCNVEFYDENGKSDYSDEIFGRALVLEADGNDSFPFA
uniref:Ig-like domain-containing protein n=1 Tax=Anolis carolinensis TaxID=28377 RepID=H9GD88_ANOCA